LLHPVNGTHICHKVVVTESGTAFGEKERTAASTLQFCSNVFHIPGCKKLALFNIDHSPTCSGCENEVGLATQEGGDLEEVDVLRGDLDFLWGMNIGCDGHAGLAADLGEQFATVTDVCATKGTYRGAVCLVVGSLEDKLRAEIGANPLELACHPSSEGGTLNHAGSENKEKVLPTKRVAADFYDTARHWGNLNTRGESRQDLKRFFNLTEKPRYPESPCIKWIRSVFLAWSAWSRSIAPMSAIGTETLLSQLNWRYATKQFDPTRKIDPVTWAALEEALVLSPSSFGLQPWRFYVITDRATKEKLVPLSWGQRQLADASHIVVFAVKHPISAADVRRHIERTAQVRGRSVDEFAGFETVVNDFLENPPGSLDIKAWS
jgi:Nitroreductase family